LATSVFALAIGRKLLTARSAFVLVEHEVILERGVLDVPVRTELTAAELSVPRQARDVVASETMVGSQLSGTNITNTIYEYFVLLL
jgi:hypothetical protein